ncbi:MAG: 50S ribosomal protein L3 [Proteobacteria bacterium]|nr:50S ribosomal protein L3 [Pseudomonadota bacterium]
MTQIFAETGECIPVTVLAAGPNTVVQTKTEETDGYSAVQLGFGERKASRTTSAQQGHFEKAGVAPKQHLKESRLSADEVAGFEVGQELKADLFAEGQRVDVIGTSKGRGTAGVVKRHGFAIKRKTHGTHEFFRHGGSIGAGAYPGKVLKGVKMAGRMGNERVTQRNLEVVRVDAAKNLLFLRGAVPGTRNGVVRVRTATA